VLPVPLPLDVARSLSGEQGLDIAVVVPAPGFFRAANRTDVFPSGNDMMRRWALLLVESSQQQRYSPHTPTVERLAPPRWRIGPPFGSNRNGGRCPSNSPSASTETRFIFGGYLQCPAVARSRERTFEIRHSL
jgi:hypothetical protein